MSDYNIPIFLPDVGREIHGRAKNFTEFIVPLYDAEYEVVRRGEPNGVVDFDKVIEDRETLLKHFYTIGYADEIPRLKDRNFEKHVCLFRAQLDLWEQFSKKKVFCKDELYERCLSEGAAFTEFIKKSRSTTLRALTSETGTEIEDEYYHPENYDGYNSIISEKYLIHWDDTKTVDDVKYAFLPTKETNTDEFRKMAKRLLKFSGVVEEDFNQDLDMFESLKNTKMVDPSTGRTHLMREFWLKEDAVDLRLPYFATRKVVPVYPGGTRDTGIGDPSSVAKVKIINKLCRAISERLPYSANCTSQMANARYLRVLKRNMFIHLDFKKFGLTFPRALMNVMLEEIGKIANIDVSPLLITEFLIEIDGEVYNTERGTVLGWMDCLNSLCVCAILHHLITVEDMKFDCVTFNDDVEISAWKGHDPQAKMEILRQVIFNIFDAFDIPLSITKTYGSFASVFLERYAYYDENYNLDMYKEQLTVKAFALSLVSEYPWVAKGHFASAWQWTKNEYAHNRCIRSIKAEFGEFEWTLPVWAGGWFIPSETGLDRSIADCPEDFIRLGRALSKWQPPKYSTKPTKVSSPVEIAQSLEKKFMSAKDPESARRKFEFKDILSDIHLDVESGEVTFFLLAQDYAGKDRTWLMRAERLVAKYAGSRKPP